MAYTINKTNGTQIAVIEDGTIDQTTTLKLVGKNYAGYGEIQNENLVHLLENFASGQSPARPLAGQVWFDSSNSKLKFYDGIKFRTTGGAEVSGTQPAGLTEGDFWWDNANNQLYANTGDGGYVLIGPQSVGDSITQLLTEQVRDTNLVNQTIIKGYVNDEVVFTISSEEFTVDNTDPENAITGFSVIKEGITLKNTPNSGDSTGVTGSAHRFWGTASNAERLGGVDASNFVQSTPGSEATFVTIARFADDGLTIGSSNDLVIDIDNDNEGIIQNQVGDTLIFKVNNGGITETPLQIQETGLMPGASSTYDVGSTTLKWRTMYADSFNGLATSATALRVDGNNRTGATGASNNTVAVRDSQGNITANVFNGISTKARYADLAEKYTTGDTDLPAGTAVAVGLDDCCEVEPAKASNLCIGVVSTDPAFMMNSEIEGQYIALKGRVPVRVKGAVKKGEAVYAWEDGICSTVKTTAIVGVALETNSEESEKLVECVLKV